MYDVLIEPQSLNLIGQPAITASLSKGNQEVNSGERLLDKIRVEKRTGTKC